MLPNVVYMNLISDACLDYIVILFIVKSTYYSPNESRLNIYATICVEGENSTRLTKEEFGQTSFGLLLPRYSLGFLSLSARGIA